MLFQNHTATQTLSGETPDLSYSTCDSATDSDLSPLRAEATRPEGMQLRSPELEVTREFGSYGIMYAIPG
jgi:hypothetical protein